MKKNLHGSMILVWLTHSNHRQLLNVPANNGHPCRLAHPSPPIATRTLPTKQPYPHDEQMFHVVRRSRPSANPQPTRLHTSPRLSSPLEYKALSPSFLPCSTSFKHHTLPVIFQPSSREEMVGSRCDPDLRLRLGINGGGDGGHCSTESSPSRYLILLCPCCLHFWLCYRAWVFIHSSPDALRRVEEASGSSRSEYRQQQQQQLTICYNGRICVCDVTEIEVCLLPFCSVHI